MFRSALIGLLGVSAMALLTSAPATAARPGCPCKSPHLARHTHAPEVVPARMHRHVAVRAYARHRRPRHYVVVPNRIGDPRWDYAASYRNSFRPIPRYGSYSAMAGGGAHRYNAGSWAWRYWGYHH